MLISGISMCPLFSICLLRQQAMLRYMGPLTLQERRRRLADSRERHMLHRTSRC